MEETGFLGELLLLIAIAAAGVALFERLRLPAIAGFLVMGALVGPGGLQLVADPERVRALAELGVVFLLFEIGLELPLERLRPAWRRAVVAGGLQVAVTLFLVYGASRALGIDSSSALVLGGLVALSSTALVMRMLSERGEIDAPQGQLAVGILLFQDLCIVPFLLGVPLLAAGSPAESLPLMIGVGQAVAALVVFFAVARFVLPWVLHRAALLRSRDLFTLLAFLAVLGSAVIAQAVGLTLSVGAFVGGLVLSASPYAHQLFAEVVPLRGVLLGLFFTAVGMLFDPAAALAAWPEVLGYTAGVVTLKSVVVIAIVALVLRQGLRLGILTGLALAQTGEFSFVLAAAAMEADLLSEALQQTFIAGSVITLIATPFLIQYAPRVAGRVSRRAPLAGPEMPELPERLSGHVVLVGFGLGGRTLARVLRARRVPYVVVEANAAAVSEARGHGEPIFYGDATQREVLSRLEVARARLVAIAISDRIATREVVSVARALASEVRIVARTRYVLEVDELYARGASAVVAEEFESTLELIIDTLRVLGVPQGAIERFVQQLREEGYELMRSPPVLELDPWLAELLETVSTEWVDVPEALGAEATLVDLEVRRRTGASVLAVEREGRTRPNPAPSFALRPGDRILVYGSPEAVARLRDLLERGGKQDVESRAGPA